MNNESLLPTSNFFVRLEEKFLLPERLLPDFEKTLLTAAKEYEKNKFEAYTVESIYFDTQKLDSYTQHFTNSTSRFKLRERCYINTANPAERSSYHLELKEKVSGVCTKTRMKITNVEREQLRKSISFSLTPNLLSANPGKDLETLGSLINKTNDIRKKNKFKEKCSVSYDRKAIENYNFRITYDQNLSIKALYVPSPQEIQNAEQAEWWQSAVALNTLFKSDRYIIVEVKHKGELPLSIINYFKDHKVPPQSFSKYIHATTSILRAAKKNSLGKASPTQKNVAGHYSFL